MNKETKLSPQVSTKLIRNILFVIILTGLIVAGFSMFTEKEVGHPPTQIDVTSDVAQTMSLNVYIQNKEVVERSDCRVTRKVSYTIPKTFAVADASLRILFSDELKRYGEYESVIILDGVARVSLKSDMAPDGKAIGSLSSCEVGHLNAVLHDTLTQYPTIKKVELYAPSGKVEF